MAKSKSSKKVVDDEDVAPASDAEVDVADADDELETDADDADVDADADDADGDDGDDEDKEPAEEAPKRPKPKLTRTTIALILLNWIAVPAFVVIAFMDHAVRLQYSYRATFNYAQIWGLPLGEEKEHPSVSNATRPVMRLTARQLEEAFKKRPGAEGSKGKDFLPVEEPPPLQLTVDDMTDALREDLYGSAVPESERYKTLEAAIEDLRKKLPAQIADAAKQVKDAFEKKKDAEKREFVQKSLFIMTWDSAEAKKMEEQIANAAGKELDDLVKRALVEKILYPIALDYSDVAKDEKGRPLRIWLVDRIEEDLAKAKGAELDTLVNEAVQRRIYYDILAPINLFRPGDLKLTEVERIADRSKFTLAQVQELLDKRLQAAVASQYDTRFNIGNDYWGNPQERDSVEKRQKIAFILFTLAQVQIPTLDKKLYAKGVERAQTVSGLYEFTNASIAYVQAMRVLEQRMEQRINEDRDGRPFTDKDAKLTRTSGIIDYQPAQIDRMQRLVEQIDAAQKRLAEKRNQRDKFRALYDQRVAQFKEVSEKLIKARQGTDKYAKELRTFQVQLHEALLELSDAADTNFRLEAEIRALELGYFKTPVPKGGKR
jgi:HPt (histidine-containing phosphotransfer) domain-containing protein